MKHQYETVEDASGELSWEETRASSRANWRTNAARFAAVRLAEIAACSVEGFAFAVRDHDTIVRTWFTSEPMVRVDWALRSGKARLVGRGSETVYVRKLAGILAMLRA